jgi:hypothetical protein
MDKHKLLEEIAQDAQNNPDFFEEVLEHTGIKPRNLMQMYMLYKFKWNWEYQGREAWTKTGMRWVSNGMSKAYAELYDENLSVTGMYRRMIKFEREVVENKEIKK